MITRFFKDNFNLLYLKSRLQKGLMLSEVLIVVAIILVLTSVVMVNYREGQKGVILERAAHKLAQDIRAAQEMALSGKDCCGVNTPQGYGVYFSINPPPVLKYILYADILPTGSGNEYYSGNQEKLEDIELGTGVFLKEIKKDISSYTRISINFKPPDPTIKIKEHSGDVGMEKVELTIALETDPSGQTKTILVNKLGLIEIR